MNATTARTNDWTKRLCHAFDGGKGYADVEAYIVGLVRRLAESPLASASVMDLIEYFTYASKQDKERVLYGDVDVYRQLPYFLAHYDYFVNQYRHRRHEEEKRQRDQQESRSRSRSRFQRMRSRSRSKSRSRSRSPPRKRHDRSRPQPRPRHRPQSIPPTAVFHDLVDRDELPVYNEKENTYEYPGSGITKEYLPPLTKRERDLSNVPIPPSHCDFKSASQEVPTSQTEPSHSSANDWPQF